MKMPRTFVLSALIAVAVVPAASLALPAYTITEIPALGGEWSFAYGISENGYVTGSAEVANGRMHAYIYKDGVMTDLGTTIANSFGYAVNDAGHVVGRAYQSASNEIAFLHDGTTFTNLGTLGGSSANAFAINSAGRVVGYAERPGINFTRAFSFQGGTMSDLGALAPGLSSTASALNNAGVVVGDAVVPGTPAKTHAAIFDNGAVVDLGTLGGNNSYARGVNDVGQVVGYSETGPASSSGFVYEPGLGMKAIPSSPGLQIGTAYDINNKGQIVGELGTGTAAFHAFLSSDGVTIDLNTVLPAGSGWELLYARSINDAGVIVGYGWKDGNLRGYLLTPIPEPALACAAFTTVGLFRRARIRRDPSRH